MTPTKGSTMFQVIDNKKVYVVDIPNTFLTLPIIDGGIPELKPYADALDSAIKTGIIKEHGKYAIEITPLNMYNIYAINS